MLLVAGRLFKVMFRYMDKNNNKIPDWINRRLSEVYNPYSWDQGEM